MKILTPSLYNGDAVSTLCTTGCDDALETLPVDMQAGEKAALMKKAYSTFIMEVNSFIMEVVLCNLRFKELKKRTECTKEETGDGLYVRGRLDHSEGHLKRYCPMKKSSGSVGNGKHDRDFDSSDDEGNAYFGEALVVVGNDDMTELVMASEWDLIK
ncbi:hypothetical protein Tco_0809315 [Tanacetum coccineum]